MYHDPFSLEVLNIDRCWCGHREYPAAVSGFLNYFMVSMSCLSSAMEPSTLCVVAQDWFHGSIKASFAAGLHAFYVLER